MIALFESGSTILHFSWWDGIKIKDVINIPYPDSFESLKNAVSDLVGGVVPEMIAACSVSSKWREPLFEAINDIVPGRLVVARTALDIGVKVSYDKPETYGIDRALAAYAAFRMFQDSCVVVDAGTAITVDVITPDGTVAGGYIFPGIDMLTDTLSSKTDLPMVSIGEVNDGIGNSTVTGITFGISMGFSAAVNHLVESAMKIADTKYRSANDNRIVITGGGAEYLKQCLPFSVYHKPHMVLEALGLVAETKLKNDKRYKYKVK